MSESFTSFGARRPSDCRGVTNLPKVSKEFKAAGHWKKRSKTSKK